MSSQNAKWVERAGTCSKDLVYMVRHFQVVPDCDSKNLHMVNPHNSISKRRWMGHPPVTTAHYLVQEQ